MGAPKTQSASPLDNFEQILILDIEEMMRPRSQKKQPKAPTFIDLFCGCGGFSLGMEKAGFRCLAAVDFNAQAIQVFQANFSHVPHALEKDLTKFTPLQLEALIGTRGVDVVVGGPPCQGFSQARQRDGANNGVRLVEDPRRQLYREFFKFVGHFRPKVFIMENVLGIRTASGGDYFTRVQSEARALGYRVEPRIEHAAALGVPQKRVRQLFIGVRLDLAGTQVPQFVPPHRTLADVRLGDAIMDLPPVSAGGGESITDYDLPLRKRHIAGNRHHFIHKVLEVSRAPHLTCHVARPQNERDLRDFRRLKEGDNSREAMRRSVQFEFTYDKTTFKDRYTRQSRSSHCSTIVAHMAKDGLMFIHPTQDRSLTAREAARVQTFPDWFEFPVARTHQHRVIGNAVPPLVGQAVGYAVKAVLDAIDQDITSSLASSNEEAQRAIAELSILGRKSPAQLRKLDRKVLLRAWHAVFVLRPDLHPDAARDHGDESDASVQSFRGPVVLQKWAPELVGPCFERSGWPLSLNALAAEAVRRYESGGLSRKQFYNEKAVRAGIAWWRHTYAPALQSYTRRPAAGRPRQPAKKAA